MPEKKSLAVTIKIFRRNKKPSRPEENERGTGA